MTDNPHVVLLAGPNGAGKSTSAHWLLDRTLRVREFVNADVIAQGLSAFNADSVAFEAGRILLDRVHDLASSRLNFAFETTLASRSFAPWLTQLRAAGYRFELVFFWLRSADAAVARVAERVRLGGHDIPELTIRRRYERGVSNFFRLYRNLTTSWRFYDNSTLNGPHMIARGTGLNVNCVSDDVTWKTLAERYDRGA